MSDLPNSDKKIRLAAIIAQMNGGSIAGFAAVCAVAVLLFGDLYGFVVGIAVSVSGGLELRGGRLLKTRDPRAITWLVGSQLYLMAVLWCYAAYNLWSFDKADPRARFSPDLKEMVLSLLPDPYMADAMITITLYATWLTLILVVLIYQGGLSLYYLSRKKYLYPTAE